MANLLPPSRKKWLTVATGTSLVLLLLIYPLFQAGKGSPSDVAVTKVSQELMGTSWVIQVADRSTEKATQSAIARAFSEVARIEQMMSEWQSTSPLSEVNRNAGRAAVEVPAELTAILKRGIQYGDITDGAFDITWRGMGNLWDFGEDFAPPDEAAIQSAIRRVNYKEIRLQDSRVFLPYEGMAIGLGGIAKGYAVDRAADILRQAGLLNFLIDAGGDIFAAGRKGDQSWKLGIRHPRGKANDLLAVVAAQNVALVTSGDYERYQIVDGVRYHHIIDPRTGRPARECQSVSLMAPTTEEADVLATAIFVLGPARGLALASRREGAEALVVDREGRVWMTEGMSAQAQLR